MVVAAIVVLAVTAPTRAGSEPAKGLAGRDAAGLGQGERNQPPPGRGVSDVREDEADDDDAPNVHPAVLRVLRQAQVMMMTMAVAQGTHIPNPTVTTPRKRLPPPRVRAPLVVRPPMKPVDHAQPAFDRFVFPAETPHSGTPEPASVVTGVIGGGIALSAWLRRRRKMAEREEAEEAEELDDSLQPA